MTVQTLQDRLRAVDPDESFPFGTENETITTCNHAADAIDALQAEVVRLRKALRNVIGMLDDPYGLEHVRDMRGATVIARAALAHGKADQ